MISCKTILNNLKIEDLDATYEGIQIYLEEDQIECAEFYSIFKAIYHFIASCEETKDKKLNDKSAIINITTSCVKYMQDRYVVEDLTKHQFFPLLFRVTKFFLKNAFYDPAITCAKCMVTFLQKTYASIIKEKNDYADDLYRCFWNKAIEVWKKRDLIFTFQLRCTAIEFLVLMDTSKIPKILEDLKYCFCYKEKPEEILSFLQVILNQIYSKSTDCDIYLPFMKFLYTCVIKLAKLFNEPSSIYRCMSDWILDLSKFNTSTSTNVHSNQSKMSIQICFEILQYILCSQKQNVPFSKLKLQQFKKFVLKLKCDNIFEVHFIAYTLAIFNVTYSNLVTSELHQDFLSLSDPFFEFCISMCCSYLDVSKLVQDAEDLPFSLNSSTTVLCDTTNMILFRIKNEADIKKKSGLVLTAQSFIKHAMSRLQSKLSTSHIHKIHCVKVIGDLGIHIFKSQLYGESCFLLEACCELLFNSPLSDTSPEYLEKVCKVLVSSYNQTSNYKKALRLIVRALIHNPEKLKEYMKLWLKVKKEAICSGCDRLILCRTISDILMKMKADVSEETEINLLCEELKICKFEECMEDEVIAIITKLSSLPCSDFTKAGFLVEILAVSKTLQEKISKILNLSVTEICTESIKLLKEYIAQNQMDYIAKIDLSIAYFWKYHFQQQLIHKFAQKEALKCSDQAPKETNDHDEENDECDIAPVFPLLTSSVEAELLQNLDSALELWLEISQDSNVDWKRLYEDLEARDLLTIINTTAETYSVLSQDLKEKRCWIVMKTISSFIENKLKGVTATIGLINLWIKLGSIELASQQLILLESFFVNECEISSYSLQVLNLKFELAKCQICYHEGKFDEGLSLLRKVLKTPLLEKKFKSTKILEVYALIIKTQLLLIPLEAFTDSQNVDFLLKHTAITCALDGTAMARALLRSISENENMETFKNDWMIIRAQLLKTILLSYLQIGELGFQIGDVRFARCYLQEGLKLAQANLLPNWTSKILLLLGQIDLHCDSIKDCMVKLNGLKYIMEDRTKENVHYLLSKINEQQVPENLDSSEDYILASQESLKLKRSIKQHFIHNSEETASPIQKKKGKLLEFEVKTTNCLKNTVFSTFVIKLEIWALHCLRLLYENELSVADCQLNKLLKTCNNLQDSCDISEILCFGDSNIFSEKCNFKTIPEIILSVLTLYKLALVNLQQKDLGKAIATTKRALSILNQSSKNAKYLYPNLIASLRYINIIASLKEIMALKENFNVEYYSCPSIKNKAFVRKNSKLEEMSVCQTPPRPIQIPKIIVANHSDLSKAPVKKDVLPLHIAKDLIKAEKAASFTPLLFNSSDEEFGNSAELKSEELFGSSQVLSKENQAKTTYKLFKSKNLGVNISSSSDVWKYSVATTPKSSKRTTRQASKLTVETYKVKSKRKGVKSNIDTFKTSLIKAPMTNKSVKTKKIFSDAESSISRNEFLTLDKIFHSPLTEQNSIEYDRKSAEKKTSKISSDSDDVFYNKSEICDFTEHISDSKPFSMLDELCQDLNSLNIARDVCDKTFYSISDVNLKNIVDNLKDIRSLVQHNAPYPLYSDICKLLAILLLAEHKEEGKNSRSQKEIGYLLSQTVSLTFGQTYLNELLISKNNVKNKNDILSIFRVTGSNLNDQMDCYLNSIPSDWTVVQINALSEKDSLPGVCSKLAYSKLIIAQYRFNSAPLIACVDSSASGCLISSFIPEFEDILNQSALIMKQTNSAKKWWQTRSTMDDRLKNLINCMEDSWLGCWKGLLLGSPTNEKRQQQLEKSVSAVSKISKPSNLLLLKVLLDSASVLNRDQLSAAICHLWNCSYLDEKYSKIFTSIAEEIKSLSATDRNPVILLLDKNIQALPWESIPILNGNPVSRMPSLGILAAHLNTFEKESTFCQGIDCSRTFYILNPSGDLKTSQETFQEKFKMQPKWKGVIGEIPNSSECSKAIQEHDLFLYCGHGSGKQYLDKTPGNKLKCNAAAILMGCSSGQLRQMGKRFEAEGFPLKCLKSGSPCVIGNLWAVTDKDIDRFTDKFLELFVPQYCEKESSVKDISNAVSKARNACKLRFLNGAAPVIYGFPVCAKK